MPGYDARTLEPRKTALICPECSLVLRDAVQTGDGVRLCESCFKQIYQYPNHTSPKSGTVVGEEYYPDKAARREILQLQVRCTNYNYGCPWVGKLQHFEDHCQDCRYKPVRCPNPGCNELMPADKLDSHVDEECGFRMVACQYCREETTANQLEEHQNQCPKVLVKCERCSEWVVRDEFEKHQLQDCPFVECPGCEEIVYSVLCTNAPQPCPHHGCMEMLPVYRLDSHVQYCPFRRVTCLWCDYETALNLMDYHVWSTHPWTASCGDTSVQLGDRRYNLGMCGLPESVQQTPFNLAPAPVSTLQHMIPTQETRNMLTSVCVPGHGFSYLKIQNAERKDLVRQFQVTITTTQNCVFIWRIPNVRRRREAAEERVTSIYSPPFYTGHHGYKMCMRVYLNGDGSGHTTHLSLFFVLMKGEYDPFLNWPFSSKVSMILVNQNQRKDIVQTFNPTPDSSSFQRPTTDMNIASGCPHFARLSVLDDTDYVKDDALYIKCIVDTTRILHP